MREFYLDKPLKITGYKVTTNNKLELNQNTAAIPNLWKKFNNSDLFNDVNYGVYFNYRNKHFDDYDLLVGSTKSLSGVCKDCDSIEIQSGKFLVFETDIKQIATDVSGLWVKIWNYFKTCDIKRSYLSDFEKYIDNKVEIYISIL